MADIKLVFEHGITITQGDPQEAVIAEKLRIQPVLQMGSDDSLLLLRTNTEFEPGYNNKFWKDQPNQDSYLFAYMMNLRHVLQAATYHCKRIAVLYSEHWVDFARIGQNSVFLQIGSGIGFGHFGRSPEIYFEFEALVTALRRCYESMRYLLWHSWGNNGTKPNNFPSTLAATSGRLPTNLTEQLGRSWNAYGLRLKDYRDCIQHYVPLMRTGQTHAYMQQVDEFWLVNIYIPDNPEVKSNHGFTFEQKLDLLTYGWKATRVVRETVYALLIEISGPEV